MKKITLTFLGLFIFISSYSQWEIVGGENSYFTPNPGFGNGQSSSSIQTLQFHPTTLEPYVFFRHNVTNGQTGPSLTKFNGTSWEFVSEHFDWSVSGNTSSADYHWGFYFREDNNLPVVFYQYSFGNDPKVFHVAQRVGNNWEEIMGSDNKTVNDAFLGGHRVKMVRKPNSNLPVIIGNGPNQPPNGSKSMVVHFDNDTWDLLGGQTFSDFGAYVSDMDYNKNTNVPYTIVSKQTNTGTIAEVWYFQGSWQTLGNPGFVPVNFGEGFRVRVNQLNGDIYALSPENYNNPNNSQTKTLTVKKWDGNSWQTLGTPNELWAASTLGYDLEIHPVTGEPHVALIDGAGQNGGGLNIRRWNGSNWVSVYTGSEKIFGTLGEKIDMVFHPQTNIPYVIHTGGRLYKVTPDNTTASLNSENELNILVYPNPAIKKVQVSNVQVKKIDLIDINGRVLSSSNKNIIYISNISSGVYFLSITTSLNRNVKKKIIISK